MKTLSPVKRKSLAEQTADHLRAQLIKRHWVSRLPGVQKLAEETGVSKITVRAALRLLEAEGRLEPSRPGLPRMLEPREGIIRGGGPFKVGFLLGDAIERESAEVQRLLMDIKHGIDKLGLDCFFTDSNMEKLRGSPTRIARHVGDYPADAWIVFGASRAVLEWFSAGETPVLALGGRSSGLPVVAAGNDICAPIRETVRQLAGLGHRRVVMIGPEHWRAPRPGLPAQAFLDEMSRQGLPAGEFNLPGWNSNQDGLHELLHRLFRVTRPTALLTNEPKETLAVISFLAHRGLQPGRDVSLIAMMDDPNFAWMAPPLTRFVYDIRALVRGIIRWAGATAKGKHPGKGLIIPARLEQGETLRPPI